MLVRNGIAVSPGVVTGPALVLGTEDFRIPQVYVSVDAVESEIARFHAALDAVCGEISANEELASQQLGRQYGAIFAAHLQLVRDPKLIEEIDELIRERCYSPEFAVSRTLRQYARVVQNLGDTFRAERATDLFDLEKRILRNLLGQTREELASLTAPVIVLAHNLTPSEIAHMDPQFVLGFATELGGHTSHTAILAGAMQIPAVVGVGNFLSEVTGGETVVLDANHGEVILDPDEETKQRFDRSIAQFLSFSEHLRTLNPLPPETSDGVRICLMGNIEFPDEVRHCRDRGADGIGLYRTEFLYLETNREPTEEDHFNAYRQVIGAFPDKQVIIRTFDLGADKIPGALADVADSPNPVLGLRSLRLSLQNLPLFKTQLRAILRAATDGNVAIMFPLVARLLEFPKAKMILADVIEDLEEHGVPFRRDVPVGMMVEVPSAALLAHEFAREVEFFSIGTNDLIQYTLAADRSDPNVADLYNSGDPSILRLIRMVVEAAHEHGIAVSVCGQMSSDLRFAPLLLGMGIRQLSVTPHSISEVKEVIRSMTIPQAERIAAHALTLEAARDVENYLYGELKKICPEMMI